MHAGVHVACPIDACTRCPRSVLHAVGEAGVTGGSGDARRPLKSKALDEHNKGIHKALQGVSASVLQLLAAAWAGEREQAPASPHTPRFPATGRRACVGAMR